MKLSEIPKEELELMGYDDIAYYVLQESGKKMKLVDIFKKIIKALGQDEANVEAHLMDFFEQMSINKKFVMLKNGYWDLQSRHKADIVVEDTEDEMIEETEEEIIDEEPNIDEEEDEDIFYEEDDETDDPVDDEFADFSIVDEEEEAGI